MFKMPKKLVCCIIWIGALLILWVPSTAAVTIHEIGTGNSSSASWWFTEELAKLWKIKYPEQEIVFVPRKTDSISERFRQLDEGKIKFIIAPIKSIYSEDRYYPKIKVLLPLWEVYLAPLTGSQQLTEVVANGFEPWYVPENSYLIKEIFNDAEEIEQNHSIIDLNQNELLDYAQYLGEEILFYEMIGSIKEINRVLGANLKILGIDRNLRAKMKAELPWLDSMLIPISKRKKIATVGFKMGLFVNEEDDPELLESLKKLLQDPPGRYFPNSYLFRNLKTKEQSAVNPELRYIPPPTE